MRAHAGVHAPHSETERVCLFAFVYIHIDFPSYVSVNMQLKETDGLMEAVRTFVCRFASVWLCFTWISAFYGAHYQPPAIELTFALQI